MVRPDCDNGVFRLQSSRQSSRRRVGAWLSGDSSYQQDVERFAFLNPALEERDRNSWSPIPPSNARVGMLELKQDYSPSRKVFLSEDELGSYLSKETTAPSSPPEPRRRIFIMEGLATDYIATLGKHFNIDPTVFMRQERSTLWDPRHEGTRNTPCLPSLLDPEASFQIKYYEVRYFHSKMDLVMKCARTGRHIGVTKSSGELDQVAIVRRTCSFWSRCEDSGSWDAVILCDPPIENVLIGRGEVGPPLKPPICEKIENSLWQGGYLDFIKSPASAPHLHNGPPRTSMLDDICHYWLQHSGLLPNTNRPDVATVFMKKIVASNYMQLIEYLRGVISTIEWQLSRRTDLGIDIPWVEEQWSSLQALNRRLIEYSDDAEAIMLSLGIPYDRPDPTNIGDWISCNKDYQYIFNRLRALSTRTGLLLSSMTGLAGIAGNSQALNEARRSLKEAKGIKTLTLLAMIFIPLAYCCGLFSMNDMYLPGKHKFWIYLAVSLPLIIVVFLAAFLIDLGYGDDGVWRLPTFLAKLHLGSPEVSGSLTARVFPYLGGWH
ncbi:hypothetical protein BKA61DRAFT_531694 [Leptodontidium sp. MPI-SDFR-AT-0119]|nr:hypothetical protein BKA61DRAFT_531694 [Leptodontidium sp. MPI-SDFR-AT-0119]